MDMPARDPAVQALIDKQAITELIYTYCRAVDRLDVPLGHALFHEDSWADYGESYYRGPGRGVIDLICQHHLGLDSHSHQVANILITLDGDNAGSESYVTGTMRMTREGTPMRITVCGRYLDRWQRRDGHWGLLHRVVAFDHQDMVPVNPLPGHGLPGRRDRDDPSYPILGC